MYREKVFFLSILAALITNTYALNMAYVEVNSNRLENAGCYVDINTKKPFFGVVSIFAANINGVSPNAPVVFLNENVQATLDSPQVKDLQAKGVKVLITLLGNHQHAGWSCVTDPAAAKKLADDIVLLVNKYQLDGVDIDDEYSYCYTNNKSMIMIAAAIKAHPDFSGKLLTKALYADALYFAATYQGHRLSDYLDYGWEMTYSYPDFDARLDVYKANGMRASQLMIGGWVNMTYPYPEEIGKYTAQHQLAGAMVYDITHHSQRYLVDLQKGLRGNSGDIEVAPGCLFS